jgi:hypothetical protein
MTFICAQPDKPLFIWQLKTLLVSLIPLGIRKENIIFLTLLEPGYPPSQEIRQLEQYATIHYYHERSEGRLYAASSKPYLFARFWEQFPENKDRHFMFIESDMIVYRIPSLLSDDTWYWSDASKYLETGKHEHLLGYPSLTGKAFGFHAYGKGADAAYWYKIERESQDLYLKMNLQNIPANKWICEMRSWMWNSANTFRNEICRELTFNDGHGPRKSHATLYHHLEKKVLRKREFLRHSPFQADLYGHPNFCVSDYLEAIRRASSFFDV